MPHHTDEPTGALYKDGQAWAGVDGTYYMVHLNDWGVALGADVRIEWDGDNFTISSPHTSTRIMGGAVSRFVTAEGSAPQVPTFRRLDALPRGERIPIDWTE